MLEVKFYDSVADGLLKFAVIVYRYLVRRRRGFLCVEGCAGRAAVYPESARRVALPSP